MPDEGNQLVTKMGASQKSQPQTMQLTERHIINKSDPRWAAIDEAAWKSKNIYNAALYKARQAYCNGQGYPGFRVLEAQFKQHHLLPDQQLPAKVVQQVIMQLDNDWQSYFAVLKVWQANPVVVDGKPQPPGYKTRHGDGIKLCIPVRPLVKLLWRNGA